MIRIRIIFKSSGALEAKNVALERLWTCNANSPHFYEEQDQDPIRIKGKIRIRIRIKAESWTRIPFREKMDPQYWFFCFLFYTSS